MRGIKDMGIGDLRRELSDRLDAAYHRGEATIIRNVRRDRPTAALVPYPWLEELEKYRAKYGPISED
jgi:antitoxin (DNA-binding transcriptional repressor) of toxin-antitoxin stability system